MTAEVMPSLAKGSRIAATMCTATKTMDSSARLECRSAVRKRGHDARCQRTTLIRPRTVTAVSSSSETMPEPRLANHSS